MFCCFNLHFFLLSPSLFLPPPLSLSLSLTPSLSHSLFPSLSHTPLSLPPSPFLPPSLILPPSLQHFPMDNKNGSYYSNFFAAVAARIKNSWPEIMLGGPVIHSIFTPSYSYTHSQVSSNLPTGLLNERCVT